MLNPDGAERFTRRTAQMIDMNRDASALATPEAKILKSTHDMYQPEYGFNLHDQETAVYSWDDTENYGRCITGSGCRRITWGQSDTPPGKESRFDACSGIEFIHSR